MCLPHLPGYAPRGTRDRAGQARLSLAELDEAIGVFIRQVYNAAPHGETGVPPQQRWESGAFIPRMPGSLEQLDLLLLTVARGRMIHPDGIHFQSVIPGVRLPGALGQPREPGSCEEPGQHRVNPEVRVDQDRMPRAGVRGGLPPVQVSPADEDRHQPARHRLAAHRPVQRPLAFPRIQAHRSNLAAPPAACRAVTRTERA